MMKTLLLIWIGLIGAISSGFAQAKPITGTIRDSVNGRPLERAVITYVEVGKQDSARYLTNAQGRFSVDQAPAGEFILIISNVGYKTRGIRFPAAMAGELGVLALPERVRELSEVIIEAPPIKVMQDTVEYRANAFPVRKDAVAEDVFKKLPGVEVDNQGNITAHGQQVTKIKVNGKDFFGGDPKMASKNIPADAIDKIQVIDDQSDQAKFSGFDDGDRTKIINITIKKDRNQGVFGSGTVGVGTATGTDDENRYEAYLRAFRFNNSEQMAVLGNANNINLNTFSQGGASFQGGGGRGGGGGGSTSASSNLTSSNPYQTGYNDAKVAGANYANDFTPHLTLYGSYQYTNTQSKVYTNSFTHYLYPGYPQPYNTTQQGTVTNQQRHNVLLNFGWGFDKHDSILLRPSFTYTSNGQANNVQTLTQDSMLNPVTNIDQMYKGKNASTSLSGTALWMHRFGKAGRTLSLTFTDNPTPSTETDSNYSVQQFLLGVPREDTIHQVTLFNTNNYTYSGRVSYTEPLSLKSGLEFSYAYSNSENASTKNVYSLDPKMVETPVDSLSNNLDNFLITNKFGVTFRHKEKKFNYQLGVAAQPTELDTRTVINDSVRKFVEKETEIIPIGSLAYQFSTTKRLRVFYTGTSQQPSPNQLQPVPDLTNQQQINLGNPNLKPSFNNHLVVNFNNFDNVSGRSFFLNLNSNYISNYISSNTVTNQVTGVRYITPVNVDGYYNASGYANFQQPFRNREFILTLAARLNFVNSVSYTDSIRVVGKNWAPTGTAKFEMDKGDWLELIGGVSYNLNSSVYPAVVSNGKELSQGQNYSPSSWTFAQSSRVDFLKIFSLRYDFTYTINQGYSNVIGNKPVALLNAVLETRFWNQKGILALSVNDLLNQNASFSSSTSGNVYSQTQTNILQRFFMATFTYKFAKFKGAQPTGGGNFRFGGPKGGGGFGGRGGGGD